MVSRVSLKHSIFHVAMDEGIFTSILLGVFCLVSCIVIMDDHALPKDVASSVGWAVFLLCLGLLLVLRTPGVVSSPRTQLHARIVFLGLCFGGLALHCTASFHAAAVTMLLITWSPMVLNAWWQWQQSLSPLVDRSKQSGPPQFFKMKTPVTCLPCKQ
jgi:hypothetical protein